MGLLEWSVVNEKSGFRAQILIYQPPFLPFHNPSKTFAHRLGRSIIFNLQRERQSWRIVKAMVTPTSVAGLKREMRQLNDGVFWISFSVTLEAIVSLMSSRGTSPCLNESSSRSSVLFDHVEFIWWQPLVVSSWRFFFIVTLKKSFSRICTPWEHSGINFFESGGYSLFSHGKVSWISSKRPSENTDRGWVSYMLANQ